MRSLERVSLVGGFGVENKPNGLHKVAILLHAVSFYGVRPKRKYATESQEYVIN
jgi:hypothetical protein